MFKALLLSLLLFPLPGRGVYEITATRQGDTLTIQAPVDNHFSNVVIEMHGDPDAVARPNYANRWVVETDSNLGTFSGNECSNGACRPVYEVFQVEAVSSQLLALLPVAVLVGFLFNFMPCVLPVLGLKLACFSKGGDKKLYVAGVMASFMVLATLSVVAGSGLSHMSVPAFRVALAVCCGLMALKLWGLWELPVTGFFGNFAGKAGPFGIGMLTVALGSSCSVPFMAPVLLYLTQCSALETYLLFGGVGVGFVAPFLLPIGSAMKKFGPYVRKFEIGCGVAMAATCFWMISTLSPDYVGDALIIGCTGAFFLVAMTRNWDKSSWLLGPVFVGLIVVRMFYHGPITNSTESRFEMPEGPVAIVVSASWCVNCKTVDGLWDNEEIVEALSDNGMTVEHWDWTNGDPNTTGLLKHFGHEAVPFVLVVRQDGSFSTLSSLYTHDQVLDAIYGVE